MDVSENSSTPKSSILIGFSIINHPFWGTHIFGNTHMISCSSFLEGPFPWQAVCWTNINHGQLEIVRNFRLMISTACGMSFSSYVFDRLYPDMFWHVWACAVAAVFRYVWQVFFAWLASDKSRICVPQGNFLAVWMIWNVMVGISGSEVMCDVCVTEFLWLSVPTCELVCGRDHRPKQWLCFHLWLPFRSWSCATGTQSWWWLVWVPPHDLSSSHLFWPGWKYWFGKLQDC